MLFEGRPAALPQVPGVDIAAAYRPAIGLSGDYYDVVKLDGEALFLCVADVAGKGAGPALLMANLQSAVRALVRTGESPADICEALNRLIDELAVPCRRATSRFSSLGSPAGSAA